MRKYDFPKILEIEDEFAPAFTSAFDGRPSSMDAYNTIMSYDYVDIIFNRIRHSYTDEMWKEIIDYWEYMAYLSPMCGLLANTLKRKFADD